MIPMTDDEYNYLLKETAIGIRIMADRQVTSYAFDFSKDPVTGKEYAFVLSIVPKESIIESTMPVTTKMMKMANC